MHTIKQQNEKEWMVGTLEGTIDGDFFNPLFGGMSIVTAIHMCSALNGGDVTRLPTNVVLEQLRKAVS